MLSAALPETPNPRAPDLALIHGWGIGRAVWQTLTTALSPHCCVHLVDLPGYAPAEPDPASFVETTRRLAGTVPEGAVLCGWSLGGLVALQAALLFPRRFAGLILIGTSPCFTQHDDWIHAQPPAILDAFTRAVAKNTASALQRFNALLNQGDCMARNAIRALSQALSATSCPDDVSLLQGLGWLRDVDLRPLIASIDIPAYLIHGENDPLMPLPTAQWLQNHLRDARLEIIPGAAHAPFLGDTKKIARQIGDKVHAFAFHQAARPRVV